MKNYSLIVAALALCATLTAVNPADAYGPYRRVHPIPSGIRPVAATTGTINYNAMLQHQLFLQQQWQQQLWQQQLYQQQLWQQQLWQQLPLWQTYPNTGYYQ